MKNKILIFGKDGQLGHDLTRVFGQGHHQLALNRGDLDITNANAVNDVIQKEKPDFVLNATAYNKVEAAETDTAAAFEVNAKGVENLAKASERAKAVFVHISTDYVFDGKKEFFIETDAPNPLNVYGQSKLEGERLAQSASSKCYIIRTSAVFGVKEGKQKMNFVDRMINLAKQGEVLRVVNDQFTSPTYSLDLAKKIKELIEKPAPFGVYHITNQGCCSWYEFAVKILELMNIKAQVTPISTSESGSKVKRPKKCILKNQALEVISLAPMPVWEDGLQRYLKEKYKY